MLRGPRLEIAISGKNNIYESGIRKFLCRLFLPTDRAKLTIEWLSAKKALILAYDLHDNYFYKIIFAIDDVQVIKSIHHKYGLFKVMPDVLYGEIYDFERRFEDLEDDCEDGDSFEDINPYEEDVFREVLEECLDYSESMARSAEKGWFYDDNNMDYSIRQNIKDIFYSWD